MQSGTLLEMKGGTLTNRAGVTGVNWNCLEQTRWHGHPIQVDEDG